MHPSRAVLIAFCDAEAGRSRGRRIARHVTACARCGEELRRIEREKDELARRAAPPKMDAGPDLAAVRAAVAAWQQGQYGEAAAELKARMQYQIETYFGSRTAAAMAGPRVRAEEMAGNAGEMLDVFLGPDAADAVRDRVFSGIDWTKPAEERWQ